MMTYKSSAEALSADALPRGTATTADRSLLVTRLWPAPLARAEVSARMVVMSNVHDVMRSAGHRPHRQEGWAQ
jgi:hypothetical protein